MLLIVPVLFPLFRCLSRVPFPLLSGSHSEPSLSCLSVVLMHTSYLSCPNSPQAYTTTLHRDGHLSIRARAALKRAPSERTATDMLQLREVVQRLSCFDRFAHLAPESLARILHYERVAAGQLVLRQG